MKTELTKEDEDYCMAMIGTLPIQVKEKIYKALHERDEQLQAKDKEITSLTLITAGVKYELYIKDKEILELKNELFSVKVKYQDAYKNAMMAIEHEQYYEKQLEQQKQEFEKNLLELGEKEIPSEINCSICKDGKVVHITKLKDLTWFKEMLKK